MQKLSFKKLLFTYLLAAITLQPSFAQQTLQGPTLGNVSSMFGYRTDPFTGQTAVHHGLDIASSYGAPIYAMQDGYVLRSGPIGAYGNAVVLDHYYQDIPQVPRVQTLYGHCSYLLVKTGQYVRRGQVVAMVGSTGRSTGPHLHFQVYYKNKTIDPVDYLRKLPGYVNYVAGVRAQQLKYSSNGSTGGVGGY